MLNREAMATKQMLEDPAFTTMVLKELAKPDPEPVFRAYRLVETFLVRKGIARNLGGSIAIAYVIGLVRGIAMMGGKDEQSSKG